MNVPEQISEYNKNKYIFLLPLRSVLFVLTGLSLHLALNSPLEDLSRWWSVVVTLVNIATLCLLLLVCHRAKIPYSRFINYKKGKTSAKSAFITVVVVILVGMGGMQAAGFICYGELPHFPVVMMQPIPLGIAIVNILILPLTTTLAEDGIYLGILNRTNSKAALLLSMFFYALQHSFIPLTFDFSFIMYRLLSFLPLTIIMCLWYRKTKNPLPFMIGHFIINLATVVQIVISSAVPGIIG